MYLFIYFYDAVFDHTFQWFSIGMSGKFLSSWKRFLLIWTSFYLAWEGRMAEQVQDSGLPLYNFNVFLK